MALLDQAQLAQSTDFNSKVQMAMYIAAQDITNEAVVAGYETYHQKRLALAQVVQQAPGGLSSQFAWGVVANPVINVNSPDGDIQFTVNSLWDTFAGVQPAEVPPAS
jgi:hypothetical protein